MIANKERLMEGGKNGSEKRHIESEERKKCIGEEKIKDLEEEQDRKYP